MTLNTNHFLGYNMVKYVSVVVQSFQSISLSFLHIIIKTKSVSSNYGLFGDYGLITQRSCSEIGLCISARRLQYLFILFVIALNFPLCILSWLQLLCRCGKIRIIVLPLVIKGYIVVSIVVCRCNRYEAEINRTEL